MNLSVPYKELSIAGKILCNAELSKDILSIESIFSDETENFRIPSEPTSTDTVQVLIRTGRGNMDAVFLCCDGEKIPMKICKQESFFDFYEGFLPPTSETKSYYFELVQGNSSYYYTKSGLHQNLEEGTWFTVIRNFKIPDWAKGAVMYQIYVDRFCNGDTTNDVKTNEYIYLGKPVEAAQWDDIPAVEDFRRFYGGDLQGVLDKLDYLQQLGIDVIYFNPLFVSPSNHKYDTQDYDYIDPHIGVVVEDGGSPLVFEKFNNNHATMYIQRTTALENLEASNTLFCKVVEEAHKRNIKIILDGVFNHCGAFHKWMDRENFYESTGKYPAGAFIENNSIYHNYFYWKENGTYDGWWGHPNHPKLNFESPELFQYIMSIAQKWVSPPFNADGWRLDVAADLGINPNFNHYFWKKFRDAVKKANPNAIILAEHYGDASSWLQGDQWDTIMNYDAFMEPVSWFLTGMEKHSEDFKKDLLNNSIVFRDTMLYQMARLSKQSIQISMNELSNHDHSRFLTRTNKTVGRLHTLGYEAANRGINKGIMKEAVVIQMTWPGAPTIYYGDEVGVAGWTDPDNRRTYPWGKEDIDLLEFHKAVIKIHKQYSALKTGSLMFLYLGYGLLSYGRFDKKNKIVVALNNTEEEKQIQIPVWQMGISSHGEMQVILTSTEIGFSVNVISYKIKRGKLALSLKPYSSVILKEVKRGKTL